ncbi:hemolysin III family protein [Prevotella sp. PINT]|jgi:channel protein, hemolysin III family|uniref:PAQR family membrane homeostasis protein TrhA n=1 Tax=Palleniella intestinalis TaxID=2736291 RepID=UPI001553C429|nr:hemolysin III family protein [Palleniella intestinalis]NPD81884.1 hemolysin III family protein [Palleniella intestinalis]
MRIEEKANTFTHLLGAVFALTCIWAVWPATEKGWQMTMGVIFFITGMFLMFLSSTVYHLLPKGKAKDMMRKCDHISIYVMIACSYTPICIGVVGGWIGWGFFIFQWLVVLGGTVYKIVAINRFPRLSLAIYLIMGWSVLVIAPEACRHLSTTAMSLIVAEGVFYTAGTYFFSHDNRPNYHAIWHVFVLLGAAAHWSAVLSIILS